MPRIKIPEKLKLLLKPKRFKVCIGGRGGGKSVSVCKLLLSVIDTTGASILCAREFQNTLDDSIYSLLTSNIDEMGLSNFNIQASSISHKNGGQLKFKGLARNPHSVKSLFGFTYCFVEEAQSISENSLKLLTPTIREKGSELWFVGNPQSSADPFSQRFIIPFQNALDKDGYYEDDLHTIIKINYDDNPWFPAELEQERLWDYEHLSRAKYDHIWLGAHNDEVDDAIIAAEWFDAAIDSHKKLGFKPMGAIIASHDPADSVDNIGYVLRHGSVILDVKELDAPDVNAGCEQALNLAIEAKCDYFVFDADGLGVSLRRQVLTALSGKGVTTVLFRGSEGAEFPNSVYQGDLANRLANRTNKETFKNRRAQQFWKLRDRFFKTYLAVEKGEYIDPDELISLSSDIECLQQLRSEVCRIPTCPNGMGLIQIESKEKMKKMGIPSPGLADSLMMSLITVSLAKKKKTLSYASPWG